MDISLFTQLMQMVIWCDTVGNHHFWYVGEPGKSTCIDKCKQY